MNRQPNSHDIRPVRPKASLLFFLFWAVLLVVACMPPPKPVEYQPPVSPLIPGKNTLLTENDWQVVEITQQDKAVDVSALGLIKVTFAPNGSMGVNATACNSRGYWIVAEDEQHYQLLPTVSTARGCSKSADAQYDRLGQLVGATTAYELQDKQLILTGKDVRVVLAIAMPQWLRQNAWQIVEINYQGSPVDFGEIAPFTISFDNSGILNAKSTNCGSMSFTVVAQSERQYRLTDGLSTLRTCGEVKDQQYGQVWTALGATTAFDLQGDRLILVGAETRIVLAVAPAQ